MTQSLTTLLLLAVLALASCSSPQRSAECRQRMDDCLARCDMRGDGEDPVSHIRDDGWSGGNASSCERRCQQLCY